MVKINFKHWFTANSSYNEQNDPRNLPLPIARNTLIKAPGPALVPTESEGDEGSFACTRVQYMHPKNRQGSGVNFTRNMDEFEMAFQKQNMRKFSAVSTSISKKPNTSSVPVANTSASKIPTINALNSISNTVKSDTSQGSGDAKVSKTDSGYPGVCHGKTSNKLSYTARKFFKRSWCNKEKKRRDSGYDKPTSQDSLFSSASDWSNSYNGPFLRKRDYMLLILREAAGKRGFVPFIDIDKQIEFGNRYHKIRRWKNIDLKFSKSHINQPHFQQDKLISEFSGNSKNNIPGEEKLKSNLANSLSFRKNNKTHLAVPTISNSDFGIVCKPSTNCARYISSAPILPSTNDPVIKSVVPFFSNTTAHSEPIIPPTIETITLPTDNVDSNITADIMSNESPKMTFCTQTIHDFQFKFSPIQPADQEGLEEIKMATKTRNSKSIAKSAISRFTPRNRSPQQDLYDVSKVFLSSTGDDTKVDPLFPQELTLTTIRDNLSQLYETEAIHDDATVVSPNFAYEQLDSPRLFSDASVPERMSKSRRNDNDDVSIISMVDECANSHGNNCKISPCHNEAPATVSKVGIIPSELTPNNFEPAIETLSDNPKSIFFDVNIKQNIEHVIPSGKKSLCPSQVKEAQKLSAAVSTSDFVYDTDLQRYNQAIFAYDLFGESDQTDAGWHKHAYILPKRRFNKSVNVEDFATTYYPSIQSSLNNDDPCEKRYPGQLNPNNNHIPSNEDEEELCTSFETVIHHDLRDVGIKSALPRYNDVFEVSALELGGQEANSSSSNIGFGTFTNKKGLGSLFGVTTEISNRFKDGIRTGSLEYLMSDGVIISTLLVGDIHNQVKSNNGKPIITVQNETFVPCVPQSEENDDEDDNNNEFNKIPDSDNQSNGILTDLKEVRRTRGQKQTEFPQTQMSIDQVEIIKAHDTNPNSSIEKEAFSSPIRVSLAQDIPQLGSNGFPCIRPGTNCEETTGLKFETYLDFISITPIQKDFRYLEAATEFNSDADVFMSPFEGFHKSGQDVKTELYDSEEKKFWKIRSATSSFKPNGPPAFVEELFWNHDSGLQNKDVENSIVEDQLQYKLQKSSRFGVSNIGVSFSGFQKPLSSSLSSPPPSPVELNEQQLNLCAYTGNTVIMKSNPRDSLCFVHWPIVRENWVAKALGDYCPLKLRNNTRFDYDNSEFKIRQYYMTTRVLLQEQYKTHPKVVFTPKPGKWINFEWETDILDAVDDFIKINKNLYPMYKGPRIVQRKHIIRRWKNRDRDRLIVLEQLLDYWRQDPLVINQLKLEKELRQSHSLHSPLLVNDEPPECPPLKLVLSKIFEKMTMDVAHKKLGHSPRKGSSVILLRKGPPLGIEYFGYKRDKARDWLNHLLLKL